MKIQQPYKCECHSYSYESLSNYKKTYFCNFKCHLCKKEPILCESMSYWQAIEYKNEYEREIAMTQECIKCGDRFFESSMKHDDFGNMVCENCQKSLVNHPSHYQGKKFEVIDIIEDFGLGFNLGNAIKYILRAGKKGNKKEDIEKAIWYLKRESDGQK